MKFRLFATIAIYFLLTLSFATLYTNASHELNEEQNLEIQHARHILKIYQGKQHFWKKVFGEKTGIVFYYNCLTEEKQFDEPDGYVDVMEEPKREILVASKKHIISLIVKFLKIKDILILHKSCKTFENLIQPNSANMVSLRNYDDANGSPKLMINTTIIWDDLKYFLKESIHVFHKMEMFNIKENQYAILTSAPEKKIITWKNNATPYPQILVDEATPNTPFSNPLQPVVPWYQKMKKIIFPENDKNMEIAYVNNFYSSSNYVLIIFNKNENAWAKITKQGDVETGGIHGKEKQRIDQSQLKKVKMIFATDSAFATLLKDGSVVAWGNENGHEFENEGGKISDTIQKQLVNVKIIVSTKFAFAALLHDGSVVAWGERSSGGEIPDDIQDKLKNVTMIFSTDMAFAALLNDGSVLAWGNGEYGGNISHDIQSQLKKVKMIFSTTMAFAALLDDGSVHAWGYSDYGGNIMTHGHLGNKTKLENVKMIVSNDRAFAVLLNDGNVFCWGYWTSGGSISYNSEHTKTQLVNNVKMIFSTNRAFAALLDDGRVFAWGRCENGGKIPDHTQTQLVNVKMILSTKFAFAALLKNGTVLAWGGKQLDGRGTGEEFNRPQDVKTFLNNCRVDVVKFRTAILFRDVKTD